MSRQRGTQLKDCQEYQEEMLGCCSVAHMAALESLQQLGGSTGIACDGGGLPLQQQQLGQMSSFSVGS